MRKYWGYSALVAGTLALAACQTAPTPPAPVPIAEPEPLPSPYKWTVGNAEKAHKAMVETFGKAGLAPGEFVWAADVPKEGDTKVIVDLLTQMAYVWRGETLVGASTISSGKKGKETPLGYWKVMSKKRTYFSRKYDNAPMPFAQMIDDHGIALHGGKLPGYPASRGCVRLPMKFAEKLYTLTKIGSEVVIEG